jgi:hypothetical protein
METKENIQAYIDRLQSDCERLAAQYGTGVRPSWVSTELSIAYHKIEGAKQRMKILDLESPCDDWSGGYGKGQL